MPVKNTTRILIPKSMNCTMKTDPVEKLLDYMEQKELFDNNDCPKEVQKCQSAMSML